MRAKVAAIVFVLIGVGLIGAFRLTEGGAVKMKTMTAGAADSAITLPEGAKSAVFGLG